MIYMCQMRTHRPSKKEGTPQKKGKGSWEKMLFSIRKNGSSQQIITTREI